MNKIVLQIMILLLSSQVMGQNAGKLAFKWKKPEPFVAIPDEFKNEDAVAIYNQSGVKNDFDITTRIVFRNSYYIKRKIRILTAKGLADYSNIIIRQRPYSTVTTLDARAIKKDGKTISIKSEDIKLLHTYDEEKDIYRHEYRIAIPGVEVGDEIEYIYTTYRSGLSYADDIYLHTDIACMESSFDLTLKRGLLADAFRINDMKEPYISSEEEYQKLTWTLTNLPSIKNQNYCIPDHEFPYIQYKVTKLILPQYRIDENVSIENWGELYNSLAREEYDVNLKSKGLEKYFSSFKSILDTLNTSGKVKFFVDKINNEFEIMDNDDEENASKPVMYFIENKKIDNTNLRSFYKYMFYFLHIPYETCFGKHRYAGDLIPEIKSAHQITHVFYSFADELQASHCLFVSWSDIKYNLDERPFSLEDTKAIQLTKADPFSKDKPEMKIIRFSHLPPENNIRSVSCSYAISPNWSSSSCDTRVSYTGLSSSQFRWSWLKQMENYKKDKWVEWLDQKDNKGFELDTVYVERKESSSPFTFSVRVKSNETDIITSAGENVNSLKVQSPLEHKVIPAFTYQRITDLYTPYLFTDEITYFIKFPSAVSIINEKELTRNINNDAGTFLLNITKVNDSVFKITSSYNIRTNYIKKENYKWLSDINEAVEQTKEMNILYKKL